MAIKELITLEGVEQVERALAQIQRRPANCPAVSSSA
jgi:hypothetical protein